MSELIQQLYDLREYSSTDSVKIHYCENLSLFQLETYLQEACDLNLKKLVVICEVNSVSSKKIATYKDIYDLTIFITHDLALLLRGHRLLPRFKKLDKQSQQYLIDKYGKNNLPKICKQDPMCVLYGLDIDEVIEIHRKKGVYYRIVIDD